MLPATMAPSPSTAIWSPKLMVALGCAAASAGLVEGAVTLAAGGTLTGFVGFEITAGWLAPDTAGLTAGVGRQAVASIAESAAATSAEDVRRFMGASFWRCTQRFICCK